MFVHRELHTAGLKARSFSFKRCDFNEIYIYSACAVREVKAALQIDGQALILGK